MLLASALLVMVVRAHLERERAFDGVLALLGHAQAGRAVAVMLEEPGRAWSLDELAGLAHTSRASLVRIFRKGVYPVEPRWVVRGRRPRSVPLASPSVNGLSAPSSCP